jgi:hypothetical protein
MISLGDLPQPEWFSWLSLLHQLLRCIATGAVQWLCDIQLLVDLSVR